MKTDRGILYFAFNNDQIDYWYLASLSSLTARSNLNVPTCLVTNEQTHQEALNKHGTDYVNSSFDSVQFISNDEKFIDNQKVHNDGRFRATLLEYKNSMQVECYKYTPFDETILMDADHLVMSNNLNNCWGSELDLMVNYYSNSIGDGNGYVKTPFNKRGMSVLWSTCLYFRKSSYMDVFFGLVDYIKNHWQYYYSLYGIKSRLYRNDYVFTIAHHIINGYVDSSERDALPTKGLHVLEDYSNVYDMQKKNELTILTEIPNQKANYLVARLPEIDIHIKNKWAIMRLGERIKEHYGE